MHSHQAEQHNPSLNSWTTKEIEDTIWMFEEIAETQAEMKFSVFGSSTLPLPTFLQRNIQKVISSASAADYQYADLDGRADLIESIIKNFPEVQNYQTPTRQVKSSNILITMGALNGIHATIEALCSPGDEIIVFEPVYQNHLVSFIRAGIVFKGVNMIFDSQKQRFEFDYKSLKEALSPKTKIILIVNPNNPATRVFTEEEFIKISEIIQDYPDVTVIEDQAYFLYHTDSHKPVPFATVKPENFDKTITFYSAGKMFNTTGTRVGFSIGAEKISKKVREWMQYKSHFTPAFEQMVVREHLLAATEKDENSRDFYEATRIDICAKQKLITEELAKCGVKVLPCEGTYYMIIDVENLRGRVEEKYYFKLHDPKTRTEGFDQAFCRKMLVEHAVGLLAYSPLFSGKNGPDNFVRVAANRNEDDLKILFDAFKVFMK